jgi:fructuronate reductase
MSISSDPNLEYLQSHLQGITLGDTNSVSNKLETILSNKNIFGIDLVEINLSNAIINLFKKMIAEKHSVRETLERLF